MLHHRIGVVPSSNERAATTIPVLHRLLYTIQLHTEVFEMPVVTELVIESSSSW